MGPVIKGNHQLSFGQAFADLEDTPARLMFQQAFGKTMPKIVIVYCTKTSSNHSHLMPLASKLVIQDIFWYLWLRTLTVSPCSSIAPTSKTCLALSLLLQRQLFQAPKPVASVKLNLGSHQLLRIFPIAERTPTVVKPCSKRWVSHRW